MSGLSEYADQVTSGTLRALAVTSERPVGQVPAPTVRAAGLDVVFNNWRGIVAPPGLVPADAARIGSIVAALDRSRAWAAARERFGWTGAYQAGASFAAFMTAEHERVAGVLRRLGLAAV
jgi:putative tricarboxylic transport membrane protein